MVQQNNPFDVNPINKAIAYLACSKIDILLRRPQSMSLRSFFASEITRTKEGSRTMGALLEKQD
ncbi:hypothetical protein JCM10914_2836 [Paenibacillus sp. JCM 10914]|nr:hypothetical protein JCM10914_2836 [Paenibacillus sp. JCM 10914]